MSASKKPQAGETVALSANALSDAYRAADIVLGKDGGFSASEHRLARNDSITVIYRSNLGDTFSVGEAIPYGYLRNNSSSKVDESSLLRFSSRVNEFIHRSSFDRSEQDNKQFGIIKNADKTGSREWTFRLQVKGLVYVRCLLFADAWAVGPPVQAYDPTYGRRYPCGNYYGSVPIISKGKYAALDGANDYPIVQECLIDLG